jgi:ornithine cyclodeaminase/alanine dehydrogenase-like protein (mu-crystallin family)
MYITEPEVHAVLTYEALIPAIRQALIDFSAARPENNPPENKFANDVANNVANKVVQPPRTILRAGNAEGEKNGWFAAMPVIAGDVMGVKTVTFFPSNAALGLPTHMAVIELLSRATGEPLAVMDGRLITEMRTAAVSAVALDALAPDALAPQEVRSLGVLGSGVQARAHIRALRLARPSLQEIRIWSRTPAHAERLANECGARAVAVQEAAAADVVLTATSSPTPVLEGRWLAPHAVVLAVGAVGAALRELDNEAMHSSCVIADSRAALERESGDVLLSGARIHGEIGQVLAGRIPAPAGRRIVFKSVGMAIEDLTAARLVWAARETGPG